MDWSQLIEKSVAFATQLTDKYGSVAWETMKTLKMIEGFQWLAIGFLFVLIIIVGNKLMWAWQARLTANAAKHWQERIDNASDAYYKQKAKEAEKDEFWGMGIVTVIVSCLLAIPAFLNLANIWNWVAVFYPELAIAHDLLQKVTQ